MNQTIRFPHCFVYYSNVFKEVQENSSQIWKCQCYYLVLEYSKQPPLGPPFAILCHIVEFVRWLGKTCPNNRVSRKYSTSVSSCLLVCFVLVYISC